MPDTLPFRFVRRTTLAIWLTLALVGLFLPLITQARPGHAHVHGEASLEVMLEGDSLVLELLAPMEAVVGFERAPRNDAERTQIRQVVERLSQNALLRPDRTGQCDMLGQKITLPPAMAETSSEHTNDAHVDLHARFEFRCRQAAALTQLEVGLFDAFSRLRRIQARVIDLRGQSAQILTRANRIIRLNARP
jgi:hypothetical protein